MKLITDRTIVAGSSGGSLVAAAHGMFQLEQAALDPIVHSTGDTNGLASWMQAQALTVAMLTMLSRLCSTTVVKAVHDFD